ncbi:phage tail protein [Brevibacillus sp. NSP2.1]|uniref:phage tail tape measure protein n=1 Tax=Brevibacillus sp. NSP2.1 TaxID=3003229 RepID=UPI00040F6F86|nr:phage tail tape measure protein [Brevibacillus sp. NSP2.1]QHZ55817.1 phage tail protein [Brevibacillus sp. NSP2.1]
MALTTTLVFQEKMSKQLSSLLKHLGDVLDIFDDVEDAATDVEDALDSIDHAGITQLDNAMDDAHRQATKLAREIADVDHEADSVDDKHITRLERALRAASKAGDEAAESLEYVDKAAGHMEEVAGLAAAGGAVVTAGLSAAAVSAYNMDQALGILQANVGATDEEMTSISGTVKDLFTSGFVETPLEAAEAYGRLRQLLDGTDEEIGKVAEGALALEKASFGKLDQEGIAKAIDMMQGQWATDPIKGLDMITAAYQRVGDKADDLLDTIWEYSPQFKEAGISAERMLGMFVAGAKAGAFNFDKLGDAFKEGFGINLNKALDESALAALEPLFGKDKLFKLIDQLKAGGKEAESAIATIMTGIASVQDKANQDEAMAAIFKGPYEDVGRQALDAMLNAGPLEDFAGTTSEIVGQVTNEWQAMANEMQLAIEPVGESVLDVVKPIVSSLAWIAKGIGNFTKEHPFITKVAVSFLMLVTAVTLLVAPLILLMGIYPTLVAGVTTLSGVMSGFGLASLSALWPILLVIAAVIALIAVGWWLYENWDMVSAYLVAGWEWVKNAGVAVWEGISAYLNTVIAFWKGIFTAFTQFITGNWSGAWETIKTTFLNAFTTIDGWFGGWISGLFESGQKIITTIVDGILSVKDKVADAISKVFEWADQFLPHSDADLGPFSRLTDSGMAIPETMAIGVEASGDSLATAMEDSFSKVPSYTPSLANTGVAQAAVGEQNAGSTYVDFRPTIQVTLQTSNINSKEDLDALSEKIADTLAEKVQHVLVGIGTVVLE